MKSLKANQMLTNLSAAMDTKNDALLDASIKGDVNAIEELIAEGADVHAADKYGFTPLHNAAIGGSNAAIEVLISKGADVNAVDREGRTPLHAAAFGNQVKAILALLAKGTNVNAMDNNFNTPLLCAVLNCCVAAAVTLLAMGSDVNVTNKENDNTLLHEAACLAYDNPIAVIEALLANGGAEVNALNEEGNSPLGCVDQSSVKVVEVLTAQGALPYDLVRRK